MPTFEIEDIERLNVTPGDVLLVTVPQRTSAVTVDHIKTAFETSLPVRVIVKTSDVEALVVSASLLGQAQSAAEADRIAAAVQRAKDAPGTTVTVDGAE